MKRRINIKYKSEVVSIDVPLRDPTYIESRQKNISAIHKSKKTYDRKRFKRIDKENLYE